MKTTSSLVGSKAASLISLLEGFFFLFLDSISLKVAGIFVIVISFLGMEFFFPPLGLASQKGVENFVVSSPVSITTKSLFSEKIVSQSKSVGFSKKIVTDQALAAGDRKILQEGRLGAKLIQTKITYHSGEEFSRETLSVAETPPTNEVVAVGVGAAGGSVDTNQGSLGYTRKLTMWSTAYDSHCLGCSDRTALGLKTGFGVVAVDPNVIPLGSKVYIPGYGIAVAGDTGGAIKGNKIDLGFDSGVANWYSHNVEVYILS